MVILMDADGRDGRVFDTGQSGDPPLELRLVKKLPLGGVTWRKAGEPVTPEKIRTEYVRYVLSRWEADLSGNPDSIPVYREAP